MSRLAIPAFRLVKEPLGLEAAGLKPSTKGYTSPKFSIRTPTEFWVGAIAEKAVSRLAHIYVFAWQGSTSEVTDHRDPQSMGFLCRAHIHTPGPKKRCAYQN